MPSSQIRFGDYDQRMMRVRHRSAPLLGAALSLLVLGACGPAGTDGEVPDEVEASDETTTLDDSDNTDDTEEPDGLDEPVRTPTELVPGDFAEFTFWDESTAVAEVISVYDPSVWWDPSDEKVYGLFFARQFAQWPYDSSMVFVSESELLASELVDAPEDVAPYYEFLQAKEITLDRLPLDGVSHVLTGHESYHLEENGYGDFAWDLVKTDRDGYRFEDDGLDNEDYFVWGEPVYAPVSGTVVEVVRDGADNPPGYAPPYDDAVNNMVGIAVKGAYSVYLLHFMEGSIPENIVEGMFIDEGSYLGLVGNSGVTYEPHLHMTLLWYDQHDDPPRSWSVPMEMANIWVSDSLDADAAYIELGAPQTGAFLSNTSF